MQLRLLAAGSLLCGVTLVSTEVAATPTSAGVSYSLGVENCKPHNLIRNPKRKALLIANQTYEHLDRLTTPITDATALADMLTAFGFQVDLCKELKGNEIRNAALNYARDIARAKAEDANELSVFYFAGHGSQDMLYGIDTPWTPDGLYAPMPVADVLSTLEPRHLDAATVLIIDACRTPADKQVEPPTPKSDRKVVASPDGSFVVYSTAPGMTASDAAIADRQNHSLFAAELIDELKSNPTSDVDDLFREVRRKVKSGSKRRQIPWTSHSLTRKNVSFKKAKSG